MEIDALHAFVQKVEDKILSENNEEEELGDAPEEFLGIDQSLEYV